MKFTYKQRENGRLYDYSGKWFTVEEAKKWYKEKGRYLERLFDRQFVLVDTNNKEIE